MFKKQSVPNAIKENKFRLDLHDAASLPIGKIEKSGQTTFNVALKFLGGFGFRLQSV